MTMHYIDCKLLALNDIYRTSQRKPSFKVILNVIQETTSIFNSQPTNKNTYIFKENYSVHQKGKLAFDILDIFVKFKLYLCATK